MRRFFALLAAVSLPLYVSAQPDNPGVERAPIRVGGPSPCADGEGILTASGNWDCSAVAGGGTPGGTNGQVQINNAGSFDGTETGAFGLAFLAHADAAAGRTALELGDSSTLDVGTTAGTVAAGDDARLSDQRTPLDDSVTSAKIAAGAIVDSDINASAAIAGSKIQAAGASNAGVVTTGTQTFAGTKTFSGTINFSGGQIATGDVAFTGASSTAPIKSGTSLPATCTVGQMYLKTDASARAVLHACTATNTWTQQTPASATTSASGIVELCTDGEEAGCAVQGTDSRLGSSVSVNGSTVSDPDFVDGTATLIECTGPTAPDARCVGTEIIVDQGTAIDLTGDDGNVLVKDGTGVAVGGAPVSDFGDLAGRAALNQITDDDTVAGRPLVSGGSAGEPQYGAPDPGSYFQMVEEWGQCGSGSNSIFGDLTWATSVTNAGTVAYTASGGMGGGTGSCAFGTGANANGRSGASRHSDAFLVVGGETFESHVRISALAVPSTEEGVAATGLIDTYDAAPVDSIAFVYDDSASDNWIGLVCSNSTCTPRDTGIEVAAATNYVLRAEVNADATSVQFFINGSPAGAAVTTNIPTGATSRHTSVRTFIVKTVGTTSYILNQDYFRLWRNAPL